MRTLVCFSVLLAFGLAPAHAQPDTSDLRTDPGYVDLQSVESWFDAEASVAIDIRGPLLDLVASASESNDPEFAKLLRSLKAIQVRGFPSQRISTRRLERRLGDMREMLTEAGWSQALRVRETDGQQAEVYVRYRNDEIAGLTILSSSPTDESVFINIVGTLRPEQLRRLGSALDVEALENVPSPSAQE